MVGGWLSFLLTELSVQEMEVLNLIESVQRKVDVNPELLLSKTVELRDRAILDGQFTDIYANTIALLLDSTIERPVSSIIEAYQDALVYHPYNSELWSRYAVYATQIKGMERDVLVAVDMAIKYGRNDYHTLKDLIFVGIKEWPNLDCHYKSVLLDRITAGLRKNDLILSRWNTEHQHMSIGQYTTSLMSYFDFDEIWAKTQIEICESKLI